jgi:four helix bundle protein
MTEIGTEEYDLEKRTFEFAKKTRSFVKSLNKNIVNIEDGKQLVRSSGSVGANYIEANESLSKKDFFMRIKICRKEAKESRYWLELIDSDCYEREALIKEANEFTNIFGAIVRNAK